MSVEWIHWAKNKIYLEKQLNKEHKFDKLWKFDIELTWKSKRLYLVWNDQNFLIRFTWYSVFSETKVEVRLFVFRIPWQFCTSREIWTHFLTSQHARNELEKSTPSKWIKYVHIFQFAKAISLTYRSVCLLHVIKSCQICSPSSMLYIIIRVTLFLSMYLPKNRHIDIAKEDYSTLGMMPEHWKMFFSKKYSLPFWPF